MCKQQTLSCTILLEIRTHLNGEQAVREQNRVQFRMDVQSTLNGYLVAFEV